jgi:hypothetical protein
MMEDECGLEELYGTPSMVVPQTAMPDKSAPANLLKQDYGACLWDTVLIEGQPMTAWLAREVTGDVLHLPDRADALWKIVSFGMERPGGRRVMPIIVLIYFIPLQRIYETWFNFYGVDGEIVREALSFLQFQPILPLLFLDRVPEPVRKFGFSNSLATNLKGIYGMCSAVAPWTDEDFDAVKEAIQNKLSPEDLMALK